MLCYVCNISSTGNIAFVFLSTYFQCHFDYTGFSSWTSQYQIPRFTSWLFGFQSTKMVFCHVLRLSQCWYLVFNEPSWVPAQWAGVTRGHLLLIWFLLIGTSLLLLCTALTLVMEPWFCHEGPVAGVNTCIGTLLLPMGSLLVSIQLCHHPAGPRWCQYSPNSCSLRCRESTIVMCTLSQLTSEMYVFWA